MTAKKQGLIDPPVMPWSSLQEWLDWRAELDQIADWEGADYLIAEADEMIAEKRREAGQT
jgi:hypothetical protein